jgi:hypothetical protein
LAKLDAHGRKAVKSAADEGLLCFLAISCVLLCSVIVFIVLNAAAEELMLLLPVL